MSGRELQRIEVLSEVVARKRTERSAAAVLGISTRQTRRLLAAYRDSGGSALIHTAHDRASNNHLIAGVREYAMAIVRSKYADFGPDYRPSLPLSNGLGRPQLIAGNIISSSSISRSCIYSRIRTDNSIDDSSGDESDDVSRR
jgi:hypothetical protein